MQPDRLTISEMAIRYDVSLRTLRFYEQRGLLSPSRSGVNRLYGTRDRITLELILKGKRLGFSLREIEILIFRKTCNDEDAVVSNADLTTRLDKHEIFEKLKSLEIRREKLDTALVDLREALRRMEKKIERSGHMLSSAG